MSFHKHRVNADSSLLLLPDAGYRLLRILSRIPKSGLIPFTVPARKIYNSNPIYTTKIIPKARTLNLASIEERELCLRSSIYDLTRMWICLYSIRARLPNSYICQCNAFQFLKKIDTRISDQSFDLGDQLLTRIVKMAIMQDAAIPSHIGDSLVHCDVHGGNYIIGDGYCGWIDLENISCGPLYADFLTFLFLNELDMSQAESLIDFICLLPRMFSLREPSLQDFTAALRVVLFHKFHEPSEKYFGLILRNLKQAVPIVLQRMLANSVDLPISV